jgi:hypothetical protein
MEFLGIYGKCMTQTKSMNHTNIHTGSNKTYIKTCIYLIVEQCFSTFYPIIGRQINTTSYNNDPLHSRQQIAKKPECLN